MQPFESRATDNALATALDRQTIAGTLCRPEGRRVRCLACGHRCLIGPGRRGICKVRFNRDGQLRVPFGYVAGLQCDPIEKKPFFHLYPGSDALTFGMLGCDFHCAFCQNWITSQALRNPAALVQFRTISADQLLEAAKADGARLVVSSYNEPLITAEWAVAVFQKAKPAGLMCAVVSNGNATPEALDYLSPWIQACKVDLKGFDDRRYRSLGGTLERVTETIKDIHRRGLWLEVVTLLVPGFNDSEAELRALTKFVASVSCDIPWHVTAFHPDYQLTTPTPTTVHELVRAAEIGAEAGLRFVYAGNAPGRAGPWEDTRCPNCGTTLIERTGFQIHSYSLTAEGKCPRCQKVIPGIWPSDSSAAGNAHPGRIGRFWRH
ncbi:MAG: AmmeMemoRadiSam system radical SAM enzyme [Candidatus Omnitrophica bacterium]|nr:AmmeMemoRadiSam system radical SAM enzyme [Candidatus Omnitrophota bacterium]